MRAITFENGKGARSGCGDLAVRMALPAYLEIPLRLALLLAGLLLPGSMLLRALRLPWSLAAAFAASTAVLYITVVIFAWTGALISLTTLAAALLLFALLCRLVPTRRPVTPISSSFACFTRMGGWLPLYGAFWLIVAWRLGVQPLNGPDTSFRWSWLAEQMISVGSLDFYPPRSGADFVHYFWAESIPPEVASLYAWAYACGGNTNALWTSPVVALQLVAVHELIWRLGSRWGGETVARRAVLFATACPLLTWSVTLGQETGLTALAIIGLVWALSHLRDPEGHRWGVLAALFAVVAAGSREYGLVFPIAAVALAAWMRAPRRQVLLLAGIALPLALAWPLRVWVLTGNPFYSLQVAGLFPTNPVFKAWNDTLRRPAGETFQQLASWVSLGRYLVLWALPAVVGLLTLILLLAQRLREAWLVAALVGIVALLWLVSVSYTAGGLFYSLRVLSPALALLAIAGSYGLVFMPSSRVFERIGVIVLGLVLLESLPKTLVLPENPYRIAPREWLQGAQEIARLAATRDREIVAGLEPLTDRRRIVSDHPGAPKLLSSMGTEVVPLWSPSVAWLFDQKLAPEEVARRWRESGLRYLVLLKTGPTADFVQSNARWRAPYFTVTPLADTSKAMILEVSALPAPAK
jgi:hypothetical protein